MTITCPACGFENRDKAHFCLGCARPIQAVAATAADLAARRERASAIRKRRRRRKMPSPNHSRNVKVFIALGLLAIGVLVGGLVSLLRHSGTAATVATTPAMTTPAPAPAAADAPQNAVPQAGDVTPADAVERLRLSVEQIEREDRARAQAREAQVRAATAQRRRADEAPAPSLPVLTGATGAPASHEAGATPAQASATTPSPSGNGGPSSPANRPGMGSAVDQACVGAGNMLMRDLCRIRECAKPANAQDSVCVRFRKMDEERKAQDEYR